MSDGSRAGGPKRVVDDRIADWVDGCLSDRDRERFVAELRVNPQLRKDLEEYERTVASVRAALRAPIVSVNIADRVMQAIGQPQVLTPPLRFRPSWRSMVWSLAAAAALLTFAVWLNAWEGKPAAVSTTDQADAPLRAKEAPAIEPPAVGAQDDPLRALLRENAGPKLELRDSSNPTASGAPDPGSKKAAEPGPVFGAPVQTGTAIGGGAGEQANSGEALSRMSTAGASKPGPAPSKPEGSARSVASPETSASPVGSVATTELAPQLAGRQVGDEPAGGAGMAKAGAPTAPGPAGAAAPPADGTVVPAPRSETEEQLDVRGAKDRASSETTKAQGEVDPKDRDREDRDSEERVPGAGGRRYGKGGAPGRGALGTATSPPRGAPSAAPPIPVVVITSLRAKAAQVSEASPETKDKRGRAADGGAVEVGATLGFLAAPDLGAFFLAQFAPAPEAKELPARELAGAASWSANQVWAYKSLRAEPLLPVATIATEALEDKKLRGVDPLPVRDGQGAILGGAGGGEGAPGWTERAWIVEGDRTEVFDLLRRLAELARKEGFQLVNGELPADAPELQQRDQSRLLKFDATGVPVATPAPSPVAPLKLPASPTPAPADAAEKSPDKAVAPPTRIILRFRTQS